jgi:hypothetical protein
VTGAPRIDDDPRSAFARQSERARTRARRSQGSVSEEPSPSLPIRLIYLVRDIQRRPVSPTPTATKAQANRPVVPKLPPSSRRPRGTTTTRGGRSAAQRSDDGGELLCGQPGRGGRAGRTTPDDEESLKDTRDTDPIARTRRGTMQPLAGAPDVVGRGNPIQDDADAHAEPDAERQCATVGCVRGLRVGREAPRFASSPDSQPRQPRAKGGRWSTAR